MGVNVRTLLTEHASEGIHTPLERVSYSVIANRFTGFGGYGCNAVEARRLDNHYLLMSTRTVGDIRWEPFGIVDLDKPITALDRMYDEAKRIAEERAKEDGNSVLDLTSRGEKVRGDDKFFVPDEYFGRCA